jgi:hypothetical protein
MDSVPILAAPGEVVLNRHQEAWIENQTGMPGLLDSALSSVRTPHYAMAGGGRVGSALAGVKQGVAAMASAVLAQFPSLSVTSTTGGTHAKNSYHYQGEAVDLGGTPGVMNAAANYIKQTGLYKRLTEGIHNPNLSVKFGQNVDPGYWGASTWGQHLNHIHIAVAGALGALGNLAAAGIRTPVVKGTPASVAGTLNAGLRKLTAQTNRALGRIRASDTTDAAAVGQAPPGQVRGWLSSALRSTGLLTSSNLNLLYGRAMQESSGNPRAINNWDSNAAAGTPSKGLLQVIDPTFNRFSTKGHSNIWNPVDNAIAAVRYMMSRYGHIVGPGPGGYARGGRVGMRRAATGAINPITGTATAAAASPSARISISRLRLFETSPL